MTSTPQSKTTAAFFAQSALSFGVSLIGVVVGIAYLPVDAWMRAFLSLGLLFVVSSSFSLAKCVRDQQEANSLTSRVDQVRLEKMLAEYDPYRGPEVA